MADSSTGFHESEERLRPQTKDYHRAIVSLMEELEAVDWYNQRIDASEDPELQTILAHNRDEEKEHAAMTLEWLRRRDPELDRVLRMYLFTEDPVTEIEEAVEGNRNGHGNGSSLGIGSLRARSHR
jgi:uncharacterized protein